jgi:hypothetical protein
VVAPFLCVFFVVVAVPVVAVLEPVCVAEDELPACANAIELVTASAQRTVSTFFISFSPWDPVGLSGHVDPKQIVMQKFAESKKTRNG